MKIIRNVLLGLCLLAGLVLLWDTLPFYATDDTQPQVSEAGATADASLETAIFAGGCFWCMEPPFDKLAGVVATTSGYTGGSTENPTYGEVSAGGTGHVEAVKVTYDPSQVSYDQLLSVFWQNVDPLDNTGQFCDKGSQYRSAIFVATPAQRDLAQATRQDLAQTRFPQQPIATEIIPAQPFYPAEEYHQDYYLKHPVRYKIYRNGCGRDQRLEKVWGKS